MAIDLTGIFDFDLQIEYLHNSVRFCCVTKNQVIFDEIMVLQEQAGIRVTPLDELNKVWLEVATSAIALQLAERIALHFETQGFKVQRVMQNKSLKAETIQSFILG